MKITKAKLIKGTYLEVSFSDGNAEVNKSYPHTEAPPKLMKAFQYLNHHLCDLTDQRDATGQPDYDNVVCRGYSVKGDDEKEGVVVTGVRTLKNGKTITMNSPFTNIEIADSDYSNIKQLVECLDRCRDEIKTFMANNKSEDEIQGKLFNTPSENFIVKSEKTATELTEQALEGNEVDVTHLYKPTQKQLDEEMPLTQEMVHANNARKNRKKADK